MASLSHAAVDVLNFDYTIEAGNVPWKPIRVFDNGTHVYIQLPPDVRRGTDRDPRLRHSAESDRRRTPPSGSRALAAVVRGRTGSDRGSAAVALDPDAASGQLRIAQGAKR